jgi:PAS domain S-box-containing protein
MITFTDKLFQQEKVESKEGIEALFLYATEGILFTNADGIIISVNPSAEKLFGYEKGELPGKPVEVLIPGRFGKAHEDHRQHYNEHPYARRMGIGMELFGRKKNNTEFPVEISLSPYKSSEGHFVIAFIIDITFRIQAEEKLRNHSNELEKQVKNRTLILEEAITELERTKEELNEALEKERELNELKSRFVSMASHEFRTPLATIMSSLSLVTKYGEQNDKEKQSKHIVRIKSSITNLTDILNDFLSVSKLEEGKLANMPEQFVLKSFFADILGEMHSLLKQGQTIRLNYDGEGNEEVLLDKKLLKNILFNLISNAIKFSDEGKPVEVASEIKNGLLRISVKDHGIGIPKEDQKHLFDRFFRSRNATNIQGTGLGLNIVAKYLELMDGAIEYQSTENIGTTFTITFHQ